MPRVENTIRIDDAKIIIRNFEGKETKFNPPGRRNFGVIIPTIEQAVAMQGDGWNVKWLEPRPDAEEGTERVPWLPVDIDYQKYRPPHIVVITSKNRRNIGEDEVETLQWANLVLVDMIIRPYTWDPEHGKIKAYLQTMFATIELDELQQKYEEAPLPDIPQ